MRTAPLVRLCLLLLLATMAASAARAQLAQSFYNITGVKTDILPNAVRITIETDGNIDMGVDFLEFIDFGPNGDNFTLLPLRKFRLRFVGAKAKIPAFVEIGKYPVDAVNVSLARDKFKNPFFNRRDNYDPADPALPAVDVELRLYVPIKVSLFSFRFGGGSGWSFSSSLGMRPLEASVTATPDNRGVIITVITDRAESNRRGGMIRRSPPAGHQHHLHVTRTEAGLSIDALHVPLSDVVSEVARTSGIPVTAQTDAIDTDITLYLPNAGIDAFLRSLTKGYGLLAVPNPNGSVGGYVVGRGGFASVSERIPVQYQTAENLRVLFPDFLLPALRADIENNALIVTGSPALVERVRADAALLDVPTAMVRVEATAYEFRDSDDAAFALSALVSEGKAAFDTSVGTVSVTLADGQREQFQARLNALVARGRAKLAARPSVVVQSGQRGTLFFGQTRFLQVLQSTFGGLTGVVINIPVGTTIAVTPTMAASPGADILLDLAPRFSTVDATEVGTGLPTLGIREITSTVRVRAEDTILVAGLVNTNETRSRRGIFGIGARDEGASRVTLAILVTAKRVN